MTKQQNSDKSPRPLRFLWLTFDFSSCLPTSTDSITPQLFLTLMAHPAVNQIKRFTTQSAALGPDDIAQWEPGIFTLQTYRSSLLDILTHVSASLTPHLTLDHQNQGPPEVTVYTQLGGRHYLLHSRLSAEDIKPLAQDIEAMVCEYEKP